MTMSSYEEMSTQDKLAIKVNILTVPPFWSMGQLLVSSLINPYVSFLCLLNLINTPCS